MLVNYTSCQLQQIEASLLRRPFSPICKSDGSFSVIQCTMTPKLKCWKVDRNGRKIEDYDITFNSKPHPQQPSGVGKEKEKRIKQQSTLDDEEIGTQAVKHQ